MRISKKKRGGARKGAGDRGEEMEEMEENECKRKENKQKDRLRGREANELE